MAASESFGHRSCLATSSRHFRTSDPKPILTTPRAAARRTARSIERPQPLGIDEYEKYYRTGSTDLELIERVFSGSLENNQIRAALWPYLFGLVLHRGRFEQVSVVAQQHQHQQNHQQTASAPATGYVFIEHEGNASRWKELEQLYLSYETQWRAITRDQEERFSLFRERKALIGRDVIRCDRLHPFYAEQPKNLDRLSCLLMTYMMFDFDIGYVQGMSDLAGPILYMFEGDLVKAFWVFVEVMKLVRRNFEHTQKSIHFQLSCLFELIRITDAKFAKYLEEQESSNCFFAFRAIVCQFKRELTKDDERYYEKCLKLWDTIWCVERRCVLQFQQSNNRWTTAPPDTQRHNLTETEMYILALCLVMILRERDLILSNRLDGNDIHLHFIEPKLANDLDSFIDSAINIYWIMKNDLDLSRLTSPRSSNGDDNAGQTYPLLAATLAPLIKNSTSTNLACSNPLDEFHLGSPGSLEGCDFLNDFLIINRVPGR